MPRRALRAAISCTIAAFVIAVGCSQVTEPPKVPTTLSLTGPSSADATVAEGIGSCTLPLTLAASGGTLPANLSDATATITWTALASQVVATEQATAAQIAQWFAVMELGPNASATAQRLLARDRAFKVKHEVSYSANGASRSIAHEFTCTWAPVATVTLSAGATTPMRVPNARQLTATLKDAAGGTLSGRVVVWTTSAAAVATVSATGLVTAVGSGTVKITAASEDKTAEMSIEVFAPVATVALAPATRVISIDQLITPGVTLKDSLGRLLTQRVVSWQSSNTAIATVNNNGAVRGVALGTATITATSEGKSGTATITVEPAIASVVIGPSAPAVSMGRTLALTATPKSAAGADLSKRPTVWTSQDTTTLKVDTAGVITGVKLGGGVVSANVDGQSATVTVTVQVAVDTIMVTPASVLLARGESKQLITVLKSATGQTLTNRPITWTSSAPEIAWVASGVVVGSKVGSASIIASVDGRSDTVAVEVLVPVKTVTVSPAPASVPQHLTLQLAALLADSVGGIPGGHAITWASNNTPVATVDATGLVLGVTPGIATISATANGITGSSIVTVLNAVASVVIAPDADSVQVGDLATLVATVKDGFGVILANRVIEWSSADPAIATVDGFGGVTGVAVGSAKLIAKSEAKADTISVKVLARQPVATAALATTIGYVPNGTTLALALTLKDAAGMALRGRVVTWTSSAPSIATVGNTGVVTGVALGKTTITASAEGKTTTVDLDVVKPVASITLTPASDTLQPGQTQQLTVTLRDAASAVLTGRVLEWTSGNTSVATVSPTGLVTAVGLGTSAIIVTADGKQQTAAILVVAPVATVELLPDLARVPLGGTLAMLPVPKDAAGNTLFGRTYTWQSSNTAVATVSTAGVVTAVALGTTNITATSEGKSGVRSVTVSRPVSTITVAPVSQTIAAGIALKIVPTLKDATGVTLVGGIITWTTSSSAIATVASDGTVTGIGQGTATITASVEGKSATAAITVFMPVEAVRFVATAPQVRVDATLELDVTLLDKNGAPIVGRPIAWESSNPAVATVASGIVTGVAEGSTTITATSEGKSASVVVLSRSPVMQVITNPFNPVLDPGETAQLSAVALGVLGDTLTGRTVTWSSANPAVATVSSAGLVRAVGPGIANITAFVDEGYGFAVVQVDTPSLSKVTLSPAAVTLPMGSTAQISAALTNSLGGVITGKTVTWTSSNATIASVAGGLVTAWKQGTVTITGTAETFSGTATITVPPYGSVTTVTINQMSSTVLVGADAYISAIVRDENGVDLQGRTPQPTIAYTQTNPAVLTLESTTGQIRGLVPGTTTVTATSEGKSASITLTVVAAGTMGFAEVTPAQYSLLVGQTKSLSARLYDASNSWVSGAPFTFVSSDATIASVSAVGLVTGLKSGTATITATGGGKSATSTIVVGRPAVFRVTLLPEITQALVGETRQFTAEVIDNTTTVLTDRTVTWRTTDATIATISATGLATAKRIGNAMICSIAEASEDCGTLKVVSALPAVASISISPAVLEMWQWTPEPTAQLTLVALDGGGGFLHGMPATWASSNPAIASVNSTGAVTAKTRGTAMVTATVQGKTATSWIVVDQRKIFYMFAFGPQQMRVGEKAAIKFRLNDEAGNLLDPTTRSFTYRSLSPGIATVSADGLITAQSLGAAEIQVMSEGQTSSFTVLVVGGDDPVVSVEIAPKADTIWVDSVAVLTASYTRASGAKFIGHGVVWSSSDPSIGSVPQYGDVYGWGTQVVGPVLGLKPGKITITATVGGKSATADVVVIPPTPVATVTLSPNPAEIVVNTGEYIGYMLKDASGRVLGARPITWTTANTAIAIVDANGRVVGKAIGATTVTATSEGKSGSATVQIVASAPQVASVAVTPNPSSVAAGSSVQLSATVRDASNVVLAGRAITWASSNTTIATVSGSGLVTGKAAGTATITASSSGISGSSVLTVTSTSSGGGGSGGGSGGGGTCEAWVSVAAPAANTETAYAQLPYPKGVDWKLKHTRSFGTSKYTVTFRNRYTRKLYMGVGGPSGTKMTQSSTYVVMEPGGTATNYNYPVNPSTIWVYVTAARFDTFGAKAFCE